MGCAPSTRSELNAPKLSQLDSLEGHRSAIDDFLQKEVDLELTHEKTYKKDAAERMEKLEEEMKGLTKDQRQAMIQSWKVDGPKWEEVKKKAHEDMKSKIQEGQKENVAALWEEFDANGDGILDKDENRLLVQKYLQAMEKNFPQIFSFHTEAQCTILVDSTMAVVRASLHAENMHGGLVETLVNNMCIEQEDKLKQDMRIFCMITKSKIQERIQLMIKDHEKIADELLEQMDLDHDGKVVRSEFEACFSEVMMQAFDMEAIGKRMAKLSEDANAAQQKKLQESSEQNQEAKEEVAEQKQEAK